MKIVTTVNLPGWKGSDVQNFVYLPQNLRVAEAYLRTQAHATCLACKLRVRAVFHKTVQVCHFYCNFKLGFTCRITVIFGTLKDGSRLVNTLASNTCFSYRNMFQNGFDTLSKNYWRLFVKSAKFYLVRIIRKCSNFASLWHKHLLRNYKWHFRLPMSAFATAIWKPIETSTFHTQFCVPALSCFHCYWLLWKSKIPFVICNSLITVYHELAKIDENRMIFFFFFYKKPFWHIVSAILKEVSASETISWC